MPLAESIQVGCEVGPVSHSIAATNALMTSAGVPCQGEVSRPPDTADCGMGPCEGASASPWAQARSSADACDLQLHGTEGSAVLHLPALGAHLQQAHSI